MLVKWTILYVFFIDYWHLVFGFYFFLLKLFSSRESILFTEVINLIMLLPAFCLLFANGFCQITKPTLNTKAIVRPKCLNKSNIHTLVLVRLNEIERQATHAHTHSWKRSSSKPNDLYKSINANAMNTIGPFVGWNVQKQFFIAISQIKMANTHTHNTSCTPYINSDKSDQLPKQPNKTMNKNVLCVLGYWMRKGIDGTTTTMPFKPMKM